MAKAQKKLEIVPTIKVCIYRFTGKCL